MPAAAPVEPTPRMLPCTPLSPLLCRLRAPGEWVREGEDLYKIHAAEIPFKSTVSCFWGPALF